VPPGWLCHAYRFEVDRQSRRRSISSHEGARRFAWDWELELIEHQLHARSAYPGLALRQGVTTDEVTAWAKGMFPVPWAMPDIRPTWNKPHLEQGQALERSYGGHNDRNSC